MFEPEVELTEKQKLRKLIQENAASVKETLKMLTPIDLFILFDEDEVFGVFPETSFNLI